MMPALAQLPQTQSINRTERHLLPEVREFVAYCPGCKTLETIWFNNGWLMPTRKFTQQGKYVIHDCGTALPCRMYRSD